MLDAHLGDGDGEVDGPAVGGLGEVDEGNHEAFVCWFPKGEEHAEDDHEEDGAR